MRWWLFALAACKAPAGPALHVDPKAQPLLDAWAEAIGGRAKLAQVHDVHTAGTFRDGTSKGTFEDWASERGEHRHETLSDGIHYMTLFDGTRAWDVDASGLVLELDGPALDHERNDAFWASNSLLVPGRLGGEVTLPGDDVIEVIPAGSHTSFLVKIDQATHRPAATVEMVEGYRVTTTFSDWRDVDGIAEPFSARSTGAETEAELAIGTLDHAHGAFAAPRDRDDDVKLPGPVDVPLQITDKGELHIDASIDGSPPVKLILDTGAVTLIDPTRLPGPRLPVVGTSDLSGETGIHHGGYVRDITIGVGGAMLGTYTLRTIDMGEAYKGQINEAGLLGAELFHHLVVEIDYPNSRLRLYDPRTYQHKGSGVELPLTFRERSPAIDATLEAPDHTVTAGAFLVDTGCSCELVVVAAAVKKYGLLDHMPERTREPISAIEFRRAGALDLGGERIAAPAVMLSTAGGNGILARAAELGYIGGQTLRNYKVTFDYPHKRMWLDH